MKETGLGKKLKGVMALRTIRGSQSSFTKLRSPHITLTDHSNSPPSSMIPLQGSTLAPASGIEEVHPLRLPASRPSIHSENGPPTPRVEEIEEPPTPRVEEIEEPTAPVPKVEETQEPTPPSVTLEEIGQSQSWREVSRRWQYSTLQLQVTYGRFPHLRPYQTPQDRRSRGTGFIIDIDQGLVLTNAHVVRNAFSIVARTPRLGAVDIPIELHSISLERDIALCQLSPEGIASVSSGFDNPHDLNVKFADDLFVQATDEVLTIGFPLADEMKFTTGVISGFHRENNGDDEDLEDARTREPTYLQFTAALNPGNSGGPLFNRQGQIIGINSAGYLFAQNVAFAIRSRIVLSVLPLLLAHPGIAPLPTLSFKWSPTSAGLFQAPPFYEKPPVFPPEPGRVCPTLTLYKKQKSQKNQEPKTFPPGGIYLRQVLPDSILLANNEEINPQGSILVSITYRDPFLTDDRRLDPLAYTGPPESSLPLDKGEEITAQFDYHGSVSLYRSDGTPVIDRILNLSEVIDLIPIPSTLLLQFYTAEAKCPVARVSVDYKPREVYRLAKAQPMIQPFDFEIIAGLCIMPFMVDHKEFSAKLECYYAKGANRYRARLIVCQIFPGTEASRVKSVEQGDLLVKFNDQKVNTLEELRTVIAETKGDDYLRFLVWKTTPLAVARATALAEDAQTIETFKIRPGYHHLSQ